MRGPLSHPCPPPGPFPPPFLLLSPPFVYRRLLAASFRTSPVAESAVSRSQLVTPFSPPAFCLLCVSPLDSLPNPHPCAPCRSPHLPLYIIQQLFSPILLHYTSLQLISHPLLPFFFFPSLHPYMSSQSSPLALPNVTPHQHTITLPSSLRPPSLPILMNSSFNLPAIRKPFCAKRRFSFMLF